LRKANLRRRTWRRGVIHDKKGKTRRSPFRINRRLAKKRITIQRTIEERKKEVKEEKEEVTRRWTVDHRALPPPLLPLTTEKRIPPPLDGNMFLFHGMHLMKH